MGERRNVCRVLVVIVEAKRPFGKRRLRGENNIKTGI
jgi:hypothetical protein